MALEWKRTVSDGCRIYTSDEGDYEIREHYEPLPNLPTHNSFQLSKNGYYEADGTLAALKEHADWDYKFN
jgi:hypothetical protein